MIQKNKVLKEGVISLCQEETEQNQWVWGQ